MVFYCAFLTFVNYVCLLGGQCDRVPAVVVVLGDLEAVCFDVLGGNYPGVFKLKVNENGDYVVTDFQSPEDGEGYSDSAKKLFGKYYEDFAAYSADDKAKKEVRTKAIAEYVKANGLKVTQYHDYGWDPVALPTK